MSVRNEKFDSEGIRFEAAAWVLQLEDGTLSVEDSKALREWCSRSPAHAKALREYADVWHGLDEVLLEALEAKAASVENTQQQPAMGLFIRARLMPVLSICIVILSGLIGLKYQTSDEIVLPNYTTYTTSLGQNAEYTLADGSIIHLNTNSSVQVHYSANRRLVKMERGEAHFNVAQDSARPFDVLTNNKQISAVGTAFAVRLTDAGVNVTVTEGVVGVLTPDAEAVSLMEVERPDQTYNTLLEPNDKMVFERGITTVTRFQEQDIAKELSWRAGKLHFDGDNLEYVISEVSRYTDQKIIVLNSELYKLEIGGVFQAGETEALLKALELTFDLRIEQLDSQTIAISKALRSDN